VASGQSRPDPSPRDRAGASRRGRRPGAGGELARLKERAEAAEHALREAERALVEADRRGAEAEARLASSEARFGTGEAVTFGDVTERRQAEEEVFGAEHMLQLVLDTVPQRVFWKDTNSVFVGCNAPLARDAGFDDPSQLVGLTDHDMSWKPTADRYRADDREVMETGVAKIDYEEPQVRSDGSEGWLQTSKLPLRAGDGRIIGVLCTYEDITERKRAEEALRRSEQFLDSIVDNIPDMIFVKNASDLRFVRFNRAGELLLGRSRDELVGKSDYDIHPKEEADFFAAKDREVLERAQLLDIPEEEHSIGPLGHLILHTKKIPILDDAGKPAYLLGISEDITDRKRAEEALRRSEERYRHIIETITDYVFTVVDGVAHMRPVEVGRTQSGETIVLTGLAGDETVVVDGALLLTEGARVAARNAAGGAS